jgi:type VI secretion system protein ImpK
LLREQAGGPERFLAQGRGASEPVAPGDTPQNRARNRRVVIAVLAGGAAL